MSALTQAAMLKFRAISTVNLPLAAGVKAWENGLACLDQTAGVVRPGVSGNANLIAIGTFGATVDNTASTASAQVNVRLQKELWLTYMQNATGAGAFTAANLGATAYVLDDQTVTKTAGSNGTAGRVWDVDAQGRVGVEFTSL